MIEIRDLEKRYGALVAVERLNLSLPAGQVFGFLGPNGAGKTSTLRMVAGLLKPSTGQVLLGGIDVQAEPERAKRILGYVPDRPDLYPHLSGRETLLLSASLHQLPAKQAEARMRALAGPFGLDPWLDEPVGHYSHGMKQKLCLMVALQHKPKVLLLDEPMVGLDPKGSRQVKALLRRLAEGGLCVFLSIHTLEIAEKLCDRLGILSQGRLLALGTMDELRTQAQGAAGQGLEESFMRITGEDEDDLGIDEIVDWVVH